MLWMHELVIDFEEWAALDVDGMLRIEQQAKERRVIQDRQASEAIAQALKDQVKNI